MRAPTPHQRCIFGAVDLSHAPCGNFSLQSIVLNVDGADHDARPRRHDARIVVFDTRRRDAFGRDAFGGRLLVRLRQAPGLECDHLGCGAGLLQVRRRPPPLAHDGLQRLERAQEAIEVKPDHARHQRRLGRLPSAGADGVAEPHGSQLGAATRHDVHGALAAPVDHVVPARDGLAITCRAAQKPSAGSRISRFRPSSCIHPDSLRSRR